jgi:hypothetical protein
MGAFALQGREFAHSKGTLAIFKAKKAGPRLAEGGPFAANVISSEYRPSR